MKLRLYAPVIVLVVMALLEIWDIPLSVPIRLFVLAGAMFVNIQAEIVKRKHRNGR